MFNESEILARLQEGESIDTIAEEMATALNNSVKQFNKSKNSGKVASAQAIIDAINAYAKDYAPTAYFDELQPEDVIEIFDLFGDLYKSFFNDYPKKGKSKAN